MSSGRQKLPLRGVQPAGCSVCNEGWAGRWCLKKGLVELFVGLARIVATRGLGPVDFGGPILCAI